MSAWGYLTKRDLTGVGHFAMMGLFGVLIASVVNLLFFRSMGALYWVTTYAGVLVFTLLTAYDTQKIKMLGTVVDENSDEGRKAAINGALQLYLDFINLFLLILRILGSRK
jgi:FtsH-binding integral membrane protein